ncbi:uncharacterized protein [Aegilops tauschii subsp. strangulata]|uniref:uncharacterized protein n=1 Tax=Aegilops tauschii subsp. strangulata TaxID=200361 RepID=UPI003CC88EC5
MGKFRQAIDNADLKEIKCKNRRFTLSIKRENPTLVSIDKFFCNCSWEELFPSSMLMAASTACSDHCPLLLADATTPRRRAQFKFESFWPRFPRFHETVDHAWNRLVHNACAFKRLSIKMARTTRDLKIWSSSLFSDAKLQFHIAIEIILRLDVAQESRNLSTPEFNLWGLFKKRLLGLAAIEHARKRQASRLTWLKLGDAGTKFFHAKIHSRRRKNFIHSLQTSNGIATSHEDKAAAIFEHFNSVLGSKGAHPRTIDWSQLQLPTITGGGLDNPFSEDEVWKAFYQFYCMAGDDLVALNSTLVVLIPKKDGATIVSDF